MMDRIRTPVPYGFGHRIGHGEFGWWAVPRLLLALAFLALVVLGCIAVIRYLAAGSGHLGRPARPDDAERILAERFARGEIDEEEFRSRLGTLRSRSDPT